jgi:hypothetical protein
MRIVRQALVLATLAVVTAGASASSAPPGPAELTFTRVTHNYASVWVANADGSHARKINANGSDSTLSADGRWLTFERPRGVAGPFFEELFLVDLATGRTRRVGATSSDERWSPVDARLVVSQPGGLFLIDAPSGRRTRLLSARVSSADFTPDGRSVVLARGSVEDRTTDRSDIFLLRLSDHKLVRLTRDGHSRSPLASRAGIAYVRFKNHYGAPEVWLMRRDGSRKRLVARCCETKWYWTHGGAPHGYETVALAEDGKHLLACQAWEGGCYPVGISLPRGRRYTFPETTKLGNRYESATAVDLSRDGRTTLVIVAPWDDEPGPRLLYPVRFGGGKPRLLGRGIDSAAWRR